MLEKTLSPKEAMHEFFDRRHLQNRNFIYVFQSQLAAQSALSAALQTVSAVEGNRFMAWDQFKMRFLSQKETDRRPVSSLDTLFFAHALAAELNRKGRVLFRSAKRPEGEGKSSPVSGKAAVSASQGPDLIQKALASLPLLELPGLGSPKMREDLQWLQQRYEDFLRQQGLFEPQPVVPQETTECDYLLLYPELMLDFEDYSGVLSDPAASLANHLTVLHLPGETPSGFFSPFYETGIDEVRSVLQAVKTLSEAPEHAKKSFLISLANEGLKPLLEFAAPHYGVELDFRMGDTLSTAFYGALFKEIKECVGSRQNENNYAFRRLRSVLLHQSPAWKPEFYEKNLQLLQAGAQKGVLIGKRQWTEALKGEEASLGDYFQKISGCFEKIVNAHHFSELQAGVQVLNRYLSVDFSEKKEKKLQNWFQTILNSLTELRQKEAEYTGFPFGSPFELWLAYLNQKQFLPKSSGEGIPVVRYRVGAGACVDFHFVCGLSRESSRVVRSLFPLLPEIEKEGRIVLPDATDSYLSAYVLGPGSVRLSGCADLLGEPSVPCDRWLKTDPATGSPFLRTQKSTPPLTKPVDGLAAEYAAMKAQAGTAGTGGTAAAAGSEAAKAVFFLSEAMRSGQRAFETRGKSRPPSETDSPPKPAADRDRIHRVLVQCRVREEASPNYTFFGSFLDSFKKCPFSFLLQRLLGEGRSYDSVTKDPRLKGTLVHEVLKLYYQSISGKRDWPQSESELRASAETMVKKVFDAKGVSGRILTPFIRELLHRELTELAAAQIKTEQEKLKKYACIREGQLYQCEDRFECRLPERGYRLIGRIDKWMRAEPPEGKEGERLLLIDYKTGDIPKTAIDRVEYESEAGLEIQNLNSYQLLLYEWALSNMQNDGAGRLPVYSFYSSLKPDASKEKRSLLWKDYLNEGLKKGRFFSVTEEGARQREAFLLERCDWVKAQLDGGKWTLPEDPVCDFCPFTGVCRKDYLLSEKAEKQRNAIER